MIADRLSLAALMAANAFKEARAKRRNILYTPFAPTESQLECWKEVVLAVRAVDHVQPEPASPWRDIESAPKDGDLLLGCSMFKDKYGNSCYYWIADGYFDTSGIWFFSNSEWGECAYYAITHWMPRPIPPR